MSGVRIYDLAKELNVSNNDLLEMLQGNGPARQVPFQHDLRGNSPGSAPARWRQFRPGRDSRRALRANAARRPQQQWRC